MSERVEIEDEPAAWSAPVGQLRGLLPRAPARSAGAGGESSPARMPRQTEALARARSS